MKKKKILSSSAQLLLEIEQTTRFLSFQMETALKPFELTPQQFNFLRILRGTHPSPQCMFEIKGKLVDRNADATRLAARLALKELITAVGTEDKRQRAWGISEKGLEILEMIDQKLPNFPYSLSDCIDSESAEQCLRILRRLRGEE
jgi:DNA-binding MarR family transcriptional regulator